MKVLIPILALLFLLFSCASSQKWTKTNKEMYATVCILQVADGLETRGFIKRGGHVKDMWNWKYGNDSKPSSAKLWGVKAAELGLCYMVVDQMRPEYRNVFLTGVAALLSYCFVDDVRKFGVHFDF